MIFVAERIIEKAMSIGDSMGQTEADFISNVGSGKRNGYHSSSERAGPKIGTESSFVAASFFQSESYYSTVVLHGNDAC